MAEPGVDRLQDFLLCFLLRESGLKAEEGLVLHNWRKPDVSDF